VRPDRDGGPVRRPEDDDYHLSDVQPRSRRKLERTIWLAAKLQQERVYVGKSGALVENESLSHSLGKGVLALWGLQCVKHRISRMRFEVAGVKEDDTVVGNTQVDRGHSQVASEEKCLAFLFRSPSAGYFGFAGSYHFDFGSYG